MSIESDIVEVKSIASYGIKIVNSYSDFDLIGKKLNSSPLVYYYNTFGNAIFDYSNTTDQDDLDLLEIFLQGITNGNTFTVTNGYYVKDQDGITSNINGIYQFNGSTGDNLLLTTVVSATGLNTAEFRYERDFFVEPPQLDLNSGFTGDIAYIITSVTSPGIVRDLGLYEDDLVEISYAGNTANLDRYSVEKIETSTDGTELIFVKEPLVSDNRIGSVTNITVYNRGTATEEYLNKSKILNGAARTYDSEGTLLECFEYQNELQGYLRRFRYSDSETNSVWGYGTDCSGIATNPDAAGNGALYDNFISVTVGTNGFIINGQVRPAITLTPNITYMFYQGHISNYNSTLPHQLVFTRNKGNVSSSSLLTDIYSINGSPGNSDSYVLVKPTSQTPGVFYYECLNHPNMGGVIYVTTTLNLTNFAATTSINRSGSLYL
jgi:hypothetical protein